MRVKVALIANNIGTCKNVSSTGFVVLYINIEVQYKPIMTSSVLESVI